MSERWTIVLNDDGPDFAVEGHGIRAFPELDRVEVIDVGSLKKIVASLRTGEISAMTAWQRVVEIVDRDE